MNSTSAAATTAASNVIVLTGASGYLGQHCLRALIEHDYDSIDTDTDDEIETTADAVTTLPKIAPPSSRIIQKKIIYALVHQSSSKTELSDSVTLYYNSCDDRIKKHYLENITLVTVALDLTSPTACDEWFESLQQLPPTQLQHQPEQSSSENSPTTIMIDCCIHTAALSSPAICEQQPEYAMSINVPTYFLQRLLRNNPKMTIVALSTDQVYDGNITLNDSSSNIAASTISNENNCYNESSKCEPCNVYGRTKVELESYLIQQQQLHYPQASVIVLRSSIMLGPKVPFLPTKAHTTFLHFCYSRIHETTTYYTNEIRSVIAVSDVVRIILQMMKLYVTPGRAGNGSCEVYCMGGPTPVNRYDMAKAVLSYFQVADMSNDIAVPVLKEPASSTTGSVKSPLNISMDSTKLLQLMCDGPSSTISTIESTRINNNIKFLSLSDMVVQTFSDTQTENKQ